MSRFSDFNHLVLATHNPHKVTEIAAILAFYRPGLKLSSAADFNLPDVDETGQNFAENAFLKARTVATQTGLPSLGDDSGLCIPALNNRPGLHSARFAKEKGSHEEAAASLWQDLRGKDPTAYYICHLCLVMPDGERLDVTGRTDGRMIYPGQKGGQGFGAGSGKSYDPYVIADGHDVSIDMLSPEQREPLAFRNRAIAALAAKLGWSAAI